MKLVTHIDKIIPVIFFLVRGLETVVRRNTCNQT